jgi:Rod binding domain-containing protein
MMKELVAPMSRPSALFGDDRSDEMSVMGEYGAESLAWGLSSRGGLGIADRIVHALTRSVSSPTPEADAAPAIDDINNSKSLK